MKEWKEVIEQEDRRKTLGKQNTVAVENPSLEKTKSKATTNRTHSLGSSWGSKQSLQEKKNKKKERLYETDISEDDDDEKGKYDLGGADIGSLVSSPIAASAQDDMLTKQATSGSGSSLLPPGEKGKVLRSPKQGKAVKPGSRTSFKTLLGVKSPEEKEKQKVDRQNKSTWSRRDKIIYFEEKAETKK